ADLRTQMTVGHARLKPRVPHELRVTPTVPQCQRHHSHQRPVAVIALATRSRRERGHTGAERADGVAGLYTHVEHLIVDREVSTVQPIDEAPRKIVNVQPAVV